MSDGGRLKVVRIFVHRVRWQKVESCENMSEVGTVWLSFCRLEASFC